MFSATLTKTTASRGGVNIPQMRYVSERLQSNCDRLVEFYQNSGGFVDARHILIRLLSGFTGAYSVTPGLYYDYVVNNYDNISRVEGITSGVARGAVHRNGSFYGRGSDEIYIAIESVTNPIRIAQEWKAQSPVKVMRHPYSDFNLNLPDGSGFAGGISVFTIDMPVLGLMFRSWLLEEEKKPSGTRETPAQFVYQYVLPGMLKSQANVAMMNRIINQFNGNEQISINKRRSMALPTPETYVNLVATQYVNWAINGNRNFEQILQTFPQPFASSIVNTVVPKGIARTRASRWATTVSEIPLLSFLLAVDHSTGSSANSEAKVDIRRDIRILDNERLFQGISGGVLESVRQELKDTVEVYL